MNHWKTLTMSLTFKNPLLFLMYLPTVVAMCPGNATCVTNENGICQCPSEESSNTIVIVAIVIGSVSLVVLLGLIFYEYRVRRSIRQKEEEKRNALKTSDIELANGPKTQSERNGNGLKPKQTVVPPQQPTQQQRKAVSDVKPKTEEPKKDAKKDPEESTSIVKKVSSAASSAAKLVTGNGKDKETSTATSTSKTPAVGASTSKTPAANASSNKTPTVSASTSKTPTAGASTSKTGVTNTPKDADIAPLPNQYQRARLANRVSVQY